MLKRLKASTSGSIFTRFGDPETFEDAQSKRIKAVAESSIIWANGKPPTRDDWH